MDQQKTFTIWVWGVMVVSTTAPPLTNGGTIGYCSCQFAIND
jgi:hypothetical protein